MILNTPELIFLTVRYSSSRLPGKCLEKIGGISVLEHVVMRAKSSGLTPIICTSTDLSDDVIALEASNIGVYCFRGSLKNKVERWRDCAKVLGAKFVHILDVDDPFFDVDEVIESINLFKNLNLDLLKTSMRSDSGFASVGMTTSFNFLEKMVERARQLESEDLDVIPWQLISQDSDKIGVMPDKFLIDDETQLRLTLDYPEDLELLNKLAIEFGPLGKRSDIETYLVKNSFLIEINRHRTQDFLNNKVVKLQDNFGVVKEMEGKAHA